MLIDIIVFLVSPIEKSPLDYLMYFVVWLSTVLLIYFWSGEYDWIFSFFSAGGTTLSRGYAGSHYYNSPSFMMRVILPIFYIYVLVFMTAIASRSDLMEIVVDSMLSRLFIYVLISSTTFIYWFYGFAD